MLILNSICFLKISHKLRILVMVALNTIVCFLYAYFSVYPSEDKYAFYICLTGSLITGICQALGEGVMISYVKKFDTKCITGWSSGTGLAGLLGAGMYLLLRAFNVNLSIVSVF